MHKKADVKVCCWNDVRDQVHKVLPDLAKLIDEVSPDDNLKLFHARYPYGNNIIKKGQFYLPDENGNLVSLKDPNCNKEYVDLLSYNAGTNPVMLMLNNSVEVYMPVDNHTLSLFGMISRGAILSTSRVLSSDIPQSPAFLWDMTAGARSTFLLPKVTEQSGHKALRAYFGKQFDKPKNLSENWNLFKDIFNAEDSQEWYAECLYFSKPWIDLLSDPAWKNIRLYLLQRAWDGSEFFRNQYVWDLVFSLIRQNRCVKVDPYIADTVKQILFITGGACPGFAPAIDNTAMPLDYFQKIFSDIYKLQYEPTIMQPCHFNKANNFRAVYYSLEYPALFEFSPKNRTLSSKISDLYDVKLLLDKYISEIENVNIYDTQLVKILQESEYHFYHSKVDDNYKNIEYSNKATQHDKHLSSKKPLAVNSPFLRGAIQVSRKDSN